MTVATAMKKVKSTNFNMRISPEKKSILEALYGGLGMTLAEAVNIFFEKSLIVGGIPFDVRFPDYNRETLEAAQEARDIMSGKVEARSYHSADDLISDIISEIDAEEDRSMVHSEA